jgi:hypothetical protein
VGHVISACGRCRNKYSNSSALRARPGVVWNGGFKKGVSGSGLLPFGAVCTRSAAATQAWLRDIPWRDALLGRRLNSRDAGRRRLVAHPASARTSPIATRMIPVCRAFGTPNANYARESPGCSHYRADCWLDSKSCLIIPLIFAIGKESGRRWAFDQAQRSEIDQL